MFCQRLCLFLVLLYSIGSRTDGRNQEKKKIWPQGTSSARQTSLGALSGEVFLRGSSFGSSPLQASGNTLNVHVCLTRRWKTTWKTYHAVDQSERTNITHHSNLTSWEAVHLYQYQCFPLTSSGEDQWSPRDYRTAAAYIDTSHIECRF